MILTTRTLRSLKTIELPRNKRGNKIDSLEKLMVTKLERKTRDKEDHRNTSISQGIREDSTIERAELEEEDRATDTMEDFLRLRKTTEPEITTIKTKNKKLMRTKRDKRKKRRKYQ